MTWMPGQCIWCILKWVRHGLTIIYLNIKTRATIMVKNSLSYYLLALSGLQYMSNICQVKNFNGSSGWRPCHAKHKIYSNEKDVLVGIVLEII